MALENEDHIPIERYRLGKLRSYEVLVEKFESIETEAMNIGTDLTFSVACISIAVTLTATLPQGSITNKPLYDVFLFAAIICWIEGARFGLKAYRQRGRLKILMQGIRDSQIPPLGEKGSELAPAEEQALKSEPESGPEEPK